MQFLSESVSTFSCCIISIDYKFFLQESWCHLKSKFILNVVTLQTAIDTERNTEKFPIEEINLLYERGISLFCSGKYEEAIVYFDKIIETRPSSKIAFAFKGLALQRLKRGNEAAQCYEKALLN